MWNDFIYLISILKKICYVTILGGFMSKIVETNFGTLVDSKRVARGSASNVIKKGAFYVFSIRVESDDIREYSFTDRTRAEQMRNILISHLETRISKKIKNSN